MDCTDYRILISGYIDGELSDDEMHTLKVHLQACRACLAYLKRTETLETVLKRYALFQEVPDVSVDFAHTVTAQLQHTARQDVPSLREKLARRYQAIVTHVVNWWIGSLRRRPVAWTTSLSLCMLVFVSVLCVNIFQASYTNDSVQYGEIPTNRSIPQVAATDNIQYQEIPSASLPQPATTTSPLADKKQMSSSRSAKISQSVSERTRGQTIAPAPESTLSDSESRPSNEMAAITVVIEAEYDPPKVIEATDEAQLVEETDLIKVADEQSFVQVAHRQSNIVEDYVYAHVLEMFQDQLVDDAVFVGYVQNVFVD